MNDFEKKNRFRYGITLCVLLPVMMILTGCSTSDATNIPFIPLKQTATHPQTTLVTSPTVWVVVESTLAPTAEPSQTATAYMGVDFSQVKIYQGGFLSDYRYFVSFVFPDAVQGEYHAVVDDNKDYKCTILPDYPARLYCSGPLVMVYNWARIDLYADDIEQPVWSGEFYIPGFK